jgi:GntR family transcriptional repressor for pyruvate dehydrogenase complex
MQDPQVFLVHDINFHRGVAAASGNPIVASLVEMVSALYYERRRETAIRASERDLRDAAEMHRRIYQAIRARDADTARRAMHDHLMQASRHQAQEPASDGARRPPSAPAAEPRRRARLRRRPPSN